MSTIRVTDKSSVSDIYESVAKSLSLAVLCSLKPGGEPLRLYTQPQGEIRFDSCEFPVVDAVELLSTPSHLGNHILPLLSDLASFEMRMPKGIESDGCLWVLSRYPFIFLSFSLVTKDPKHSARWDAISDITFTNFILVGGKTGFGNDIAGYVIFQESQPGVLLEASAFQTPSSVIAPGFSEEQLSVVKSQEIKSLSKLLKTEDSVLSSVLAEVHNLDFEVGARFLYGVASNAFNNIDRIVSKVPNKTRR